LDIDLSTERRSPGAATSPRPAPFSRGGRLRALLRLLGILLWTPAWLLLWTIGTLLTLPIPRARLRWRQAVVGSWARGMCRLLGMRRTVLGRPPTAPFLLVTNHLSYLDILLLHGTLSGVFVAKREMRSWPVLGTLAQLMGTIWVKREVRRDAVRVLDLIDAAIARGDGVMLFPEGTTSSGAHVMPMKPALLEWAVREQYPVHYAGITYRSPPGGPPADRALCWWGGMPLGAHALGVLRMKGFDGIVDFAPEPVLAPTRGELAQRLQHAIARRRVPVKEAEGQPLHNPERSG
jgi:1-acyl-sn-glycerol-3-phosphate acyltransferase